MFILFVIDIWFVIVSLVRFDENGKNIILCVI